MLVRTKNSAAVLIPSTQGQRAAIMVAFFGRVGSTLLFVSSPASTSSTVIFGAILGVVSVLLLELELLFTRTSSNGTVRRFMNYIVRTPPGEAAESSKVGL